MRLADNRCLTFKRSTITDRWLVKLWLLGLGVLALSPALQGQPGDALTLATQGCAECHGPKGLSTSSAFPMLAGQRKDYLDRQLKAFRDRSRADPMAQAYMWGMATPLTDDTIARLAAYYAGQQPAPGKAAAPKILATGRAIYDQGVPATKTSACTVCHGNDGEGNATAPRLAGQQAEYLVKQLALFKSRVRADASAPPMHTVTAALTFDQMTAVSAYLRSR